MTHQLSEVIKIYLILKMILAVFVNSNYLFIFVFYKIISAFVKTELDILINF